MKYTSISKAEPKDLRAGLNRTVKATYEELKAIFDEPYGPTPDGKVQAQWIIRTPEGVGSIYDYKEDMPAEAITEWHIGGKDAVAEYLAACIERYRREEPENSIDSTYTLEINEAIENLKDIQRAIDEQDNLIIAGERELNWSVIADLKRLNQQLKTIKQEQRITT